jgi:hypothetical protein
MRTLIRRAYITAVAGILGYGVGALWAQNFTERPNIGHDASHTWTPASKIRRNNPGRDGPLTRGESPALAAEQVRPVRTEALSQAALEDWVRRDPIAAISWYLTDGWRTLGDTRASLFQRLQAFNSLLEQERSATYMAERLAWTGDMAGIFELSAGWKKDHGKAVAGVVANDSHGADLMWLAAASNPADGWFETAEWAAGLAVDQSERSRLIEQLSRESIAAGDAAVTATAFAEHGSDPVFDRSRIMLLSHLLQSSDPAAAITWDSLSSPSAKLVAATAILTSPKVPQQAKTKVAEWALRAGVTSQAGEAWPWLTGNRQ